MKTKSWIGCRPRIQAARFSGHEVTLQKTCTTLCVSTVISIEVESTYLKTAFAGLEKCLFQPNLFVWLKSRRFSIIQWDFPQFSFSAFPSGGELTSMGRNKNEPQKSSQQR